MKADIFRSLYSYLYGVVNAVCDDDIRGAKSRKQYILDSLPYALFGDELPDADIITDIIESKFEEYPLRNKLSKKECIAIREYMWGISIDDVIAKIFSMDTGLIKMAWAYLLSNTEPIEELYCEEYGFEGNGKLEFGDKFMYLFRSCVESEIELFAAYGDQIIEQQTYDDTYGREESADKLHRTVLQRNKIILYGEYGIGKTRFIQYCLRKWKLKSGHYAYVIYKGDLESTLGGIKYAKSMNENDLSNRYFTNYILVIDGMYPTRDFVIELNKLADMSITVILVTTARVTQDVFTVFELPEINDDEIIRIFCCSSGVMLDDEHRERLLVATAGNTLMISLVAKLCRDVLRKMKNEEDKKGIVYGIIDDVMNGLDSVEKGIKFKHQYDRVSKNLKGHIKGLYSNLILPTIKSERMIEERLQNICSLGPGYIPLDFVLYLWGISLDDATKRRECMESITRLYELGLLDILNDSIKVSPLVMHAVLESKTPNALDYKNIAGRMLNYFLTYEERLDMPYINDSPVFFMELLYDHVKRVNNPNQQNTSEVFEMWQELLLAACSYYIKMGIACNAKRIINYIDYPDGINLKHYPIDRDYFDSLAIINSTTDKQIIKTAFDRVINSSIVNTSDVISSSKISVFLETLIDKQLSALCKDSIDNIITSSDKEDIYTKRAKYCITTILTMCEYSNSTKKQKTGEIGSKLDLYRMINELIVDSIHDQSISEQDYEIRLQYVNGFKCINNWITGVSVIMVLFIRKLINALMLLESREGINDINSILQHSIEQHIYCRNFVIWFYEEIQRREIKVIPVATAEMALAMIISFYAHLSCLKSLSVDVPDEDKEIDLLKTIISEIIIRTVLSYDEKRNLLVLLEEGLDVHNTLKNLQ